MGKSWCTNGNDYIVTWLEVRKPTLWMCWDYGQGRRPVLLYECSIATWVPADWPVIAGDVLEIERLGYAWIRVTILEGKERLDARKWVSDRWHILDSPSSVGHTS